mmetsp:Transcript_8758/g.21359  ORF Transcript_8758/g.21359 Transcript_8758/m.21359 type:complete len:565 (-) Transcript_8758:321-2015(-)
MLLLRKLKAFHHHYTITGYLTSLVNVNVTSLTDFGNSSLEGLYDMYVQPTQDYVLEMLPPEVVEQDTDLVLILAVMLGLLVLYGILQPLFNMLKNSQLRILPDASKTLPPTGPTYEDYYDCDSDEDAAKLVLQEFRHEQDMHSDRCCGVLQIEKPNMWLSSVLHYHRTYVVRNVATAQSILDKEPSLSFLANSSSATTTSIPKSVVQDMRTTVEKGMSSLTDDPLSTTGKGEDKTTSDIPNLPGMVLQLITEFALNYKFEKGQESQHVLQALLQNDKVEDSYLHDFLLKVLLEYRVSTASKSSSSWTVLQAINNMEAESDTERVEVLFQYLKSSVTLCTHLLKQCCQELARNPQVQSELRSKLQQKEGKDDEDLFQSSPLLQHVLQETMRLYPLGTLTVPTLSQDIAVLGSPYVIPKGSSCILHPYAMQRNGEVYVNPDHWEPQRWNKGRKAMQTCMDTARRSSQLFAESMLSNDLTGTKNFGWVTMQIILARLVTSSEFVSSPSKDEKTTSEEECFSLVPLVEMDSKNKSRGGMLMIKSEKEEEYVFDIMDPILHFLKNKEEF